MIGWDTWFEPQRPRRRRSLRDMVLAAFVGIVLGASVGFRIVRGEWSYSFGIGFISLTLHWLIIGLGQLTPATKLSRPELRKVTFVLLVSVAAATIAGAILLSRTHGSAEGLASFWESL